MSKDEEKYVKLTPLEHILLRPDTYVGTIEPETAKMWIYDEKEEKITKKLITYTPAFYKIYDEILVNARDRVVVGKCKHIHIKLKENYISIENDGTPVPIIKYKKYDHIYAPELIFGHLLTSENYRNSKRIVGGKNGYGAKLANIYSTKFIVEVGNKNRKKYYKQVFEKNMTIKHEPIIEDNEEINDFVKITFYPDFKRFKMEQLDEQTKSLFVKRAYDIKATCSNPQKITVSINGKEIKNIQSFCNYISMYDFDDYQSDIIIQKNKKWTIAFLYHYDRGFEAISFVNGLNTYDGGKHVDYIVNHLTKSIDQYIKKKKEYKELNIKARYIKDNMTLFVNATIYDPEFDSQIKSSLKTPANRFGIKPMIEETFVKAICTKTDLIKQVILNAQQKEYHKLKQTDGKKVRRLIDVKKLEDAFYAGTKDAEKCCLILTEGDSAKKFALDGLEIIGKEYYGVFPLKGKLLNVRDTSPQKIGKNEEITNIKKIMGLRIGVDYSEKKHFKTLRYGKIIILTDQDTDGSHIKGLIINFISYFWESLAKKPDFIQTLITPIVKATKNRQCLEFYSLVDFEDWKRETDLRGWNIKYYKGLATSSSKEAKQCFMKMNTNLLNYLLENDQDKDSIDLAFKKCNANKRKEWLQNYSREYIDTKEKNIPIKEFINKDLIHFSFYDIHRSIPCMVDGFKPSQRKIIYTCFSKKIFKEIKVEQLSGAVSDYTHYHHGEASLNECIITMAQNFVGSNNIHLLRQSGNFGTRKLNGADKGQPRYIYTCLEKLTPFIFRKEDEPILTYQYEDNDKIEPIYYVPILPIILVNGAKGIGTGYSTTIPCFSIFDVVNNLVNCINHKPMFPMVPFYNGFKGKILPYKNGFKTFGVYKRDGIYVTITEIPIGISIEKYKESVIMPLFESGTLDDMIDKSFNNSVHYELVFNKEHLYDLLDQYEDQFEEKVLKLTSTIQVSNMHLFDKDYKIKKYSDVRDIIKEFYHVRYKYYEKRKHYMIEDLKHKILLLTHKIKYIQLVMDGKIMKEGKFLSKSKIIDILEEEKFPAIDQYKYIFSMSLVCLTLEEKEKMERKLEQLQKELEELIKTTIEEIWKKELNEFASQYNEYRKELKKQEDEERKEVMMYKKNTRVKRRKKRRL